MLRSALPCTSRAARRLLKDLAFPHQIEAAHMMIRLIRMTGLRPIAANLSICVVDLYLEYASHSIVR